MEIQVIPHQRIGPLSLGQTPEEVQEAIKGLYFALTGHIPELAEEKTAPQLSSAPAAAALTPSVY